MEHRWGQRRAVHQLVQMHGASGLAGTGHIVSVSISGAFVKTVLPAVPLSVILVSLVAERGHSRVGAVIEAQVVRRTEQGIALEWWCEFGADLTRVLGAIPSQLDRSEAALKAAAIADG